MGSSFHSPSPKAKDIATHLERGFWPKFQKFAAVCGVLAFILFIWPTSNNDLESGKEYTLDEVEHCEEILRNNIDPNSEEHRSCLEILSSFEEDAGDWATGVYR